MIRLLAALVVGAAVAAVAALFVSGDGAWVDLALPLFIASCILVPLSVAFSAVTRESAAARAAALPPLDVAQADRDGRLSLARVTGLRRSGAAVNDMPICTVDLIVVPDRGSPFATSVRQPVDIVELPRVQPESVIVVALDSPDRMTPGGVSLVLSPPDAWSARTVSDDRPRRVREAPDYEPPASRAPGFSAGSRSAAGSPSTSTAAASSASAYAAAASTAAASTNASPATSATSSTLLLNGKPVDRDGLYRDAASSAPGRARSSVPGLRRIPKILYVVAFLGGAALALIPAYPTLQAIARGETSLAEVRHANSDEGRAEVIAAEAEEEDIFAGDNLQKATDALIDAAGLTQFTTITYFGSTATGDALTAPGAITTDQYRYTDGEVTHDGASSIQPGRDDLAEELFDATTLDFSRVPDMFDRARQVTGIADDSPDSRYLTAGLQYSDATGQRIPGFSVLIANDYYSGGVAFDTAGNAISSWGGAPGSEANPEG